MHILRLLGNCDRASLERLVFVTCLAGLANAVLLGLINIAAADAASAQPIEFRAFALYLTAAVIYFVANRASLLRANDLLQRRLEEVRLRLADKIRRSELRALETIGRGEIYATVAQETHYLSQNFPVLIGTAQSLFLVSFCLLYIATLSWISFGVMSCCAAVGLAIFWRRRESLNKEMVSVHAKEAMMIEALTHFTEGFQEIRLNADKNESLYRRFRAIADELESVVVGIGEKWAALLLFTNTFLYGLLGVVSLVLPGFFSGYTDVIYKIAATAIFCIGPIGGLASTAHLYSRANIGLGHVFRLEERLDEGAVADIVEPLSRPSRFAGFRTIMLVGATFRYEDSAGGISFGAGPWDMDLRRGETIFVRGGNGSGKSTMLKLLCGLYRPASGRVVVDGITVDGPRLKQYRELFSCIFADFHLFDRLYGLEQVDALTVRAHLDRMGLADKIDYVDGRFSTLDLSTGQRKRLAMITALLENREVYLFDEWAADQDAGFRDIFYKELLPELKRRGKTIVAVTHDDSYWHLCDRIVTLDLGLIVSSTAQSV